VSTVWRGPRVEVRTRAHNPPCRARGRCGRDEAAHRSIFLLGPHRAQTFLIQVRAELDRVGVVGAAGVRRSATTEFENSCSIRLRSAW